MNAWESIICKLYKRYKGSVVVSCSFQWKKNGLGIVEGWQTGKKFIEFYVFKNFKLFKEFEIVFYRLKKCE